METGDPASWELECRGEVFRDWNLALVQVAGTMKLSRMVDALRDIERRVWTIEEHADVNQYEDKGKGRAMDVDEEEVDELMEDATDDTPRGKGKGRAIEVDDEEVDLGLNDPPVSNKLLSLSPFTNFLSLVPTLREIWDPVPSSAWFHLEHQVSEVRCIQGQVRLCGTARGVKSTGKAREE